MKFYYIDSDFDVISVSSTDDLMEALKEYSDGKLKMAICQNSEEAKEILDRDVFGDTISDVRSTRSERTYGSSLQRIGDLSRAQLV